MWFLKFTAIVAIIFGIIAVPIGWVLNIMQLFAMVSDPITGLFILKCVGIFFFPLGVILGFI